MKKLLIYLIPIMILFGCASMTPEQKEVLRALIEGIADGANAASRVNTGIGSTPVVYPSGGQKITTHDGIQWIVYPEGGYWIAYPMGGGQPVIVYPQR